MNKSTPPDSIEFHNAHLDPREDGSWCISRYPHNTRHDLNEKGHRASMDSCGTELRFVTEAANIRLVLSCEDANADVQIYRGSFLIDTQRLTAGIPKALHLTPPDRFSFVTEDILKSGGFSPDIWRIVLGRASFRFHHMESFGHPVRPPSAKEKPSISWLAYGSSITHSSLDGYPLYASRLLHWNVWNKGLSGGCRIERKAADYLADYAAAQKINIITAELGVNMRGTHTAEAFDQLARYFVQRVRKANPNVPLVLITAFTNSGHLRAYTEDITSVADRQKGFDKSIRSIFREFNDPNLHLVEGTKILSDFTLLSADLLHPTPSGHALMGHNLAKKLKSILSTES